MGCATLESKYPACDEVTLIVALRSDNCLPDPTVGAALAAAQQSNRKRTSMFAFSKSV
jgi:hypothetical protein